MAVTARCAPRFRGGMLCPALQTLRYTLRNERESAAMNDVSIAKSATLEAPQPLTQEWIDQRIFDLYDEYCHGHIDRREFLARAALDRRRARDGAGADAALRARADDLVHGSAHQGALCELSLAGRHVGHDARLSGDAERAGAVPDRAGDPREPRAQSLHRGCGAPRRERKASSRSRPTGCRRSAAIRATTTTAARCRPGSIRASCAPT